MHISEHIGRSHKLLLCKLLYQLEKIMPYFSSLNNWSTLCLCQVSKIKYSTDTCFFFFFFMAEADIDI